MALELIEGKGKHKLSMLMSIKTHQESIINYQLLYRKVGLGLLDYACVTSPTLLFPTKIALFFESFLLFLLGTNL